MRWFHGLLAHISNLSISSPDLSLVHLYKDYYAREVSTSLKYYISKKKRYAGTRDVSKTHVIAVENEVQKNGKIKEKMEGPEKRVEKREEATGRREKTRGRCITVTLP